jgi:DNA mismatch repair protein MutL
LELKSGPSESQERIAFGPTVVARDWTSTPRQPGVLPGQSGDFRPFPPLSPAPVAGNADADASAKVTRALPAGYDPFSQPMPDPFAETTENTPTHDDPFASETQQAGVPKAPLAIQVHNTYLVHETEEGMIITDQHALHERIIYEQIREKVLAGTLEKQRMLVPEPVSLRPAEAAAVLEQAEMLKGLGIEVEPFGGDTVLVASYPAMLSNQNPAEVLKGVIEKLMGEAKNLDQRDLVDELLHMISCKAAIKAGDKLTPEEIEALLEQRELCQDGHHCPHGRPTSLTFSREELDKKFKRI